MKHIKRLLLLSGLMSLMLVTARAQQFSVDGFRMLPNDISAYMDPVRDLNDEACALLKVACSHDFAFSTPLGIVKRRNEVGEVWLYVPRGTVLLTLKHPQWGVMRDYRLDKPLESRVTYELKVRQPISLPPGIAVTSSLHSPRRDTVVFVVESAYTKPHRSHRPIDCGAGLHVSMGSMGPMAGVRLSAMRRHGVYASAWTGLRALPETAELTPAQQTYHTGQTRQSAVLLTGGLVHRCGHVIVYEGAGWGRHRVAWEQADGRWTLASGECHSGWAAELGGGYQVRRWTATAGVQTVRMKEWQVAVGLGLKL